MAVLRRPGSVDPVAFAVPLAAWAIAVINGVDPSQWLLPPEPLRRGLAADALLYTSAAVIIGAPLAGASLACAARRAPAAESRARVFVRHVFPAVGLLVLASAAVTFFARGASADALAFVATSHATLAAVALALSALGVCLGSLLRDPLDAGAVGAAISVTAAAGVLLAGAAVAEAPRALVDLALLVNPLVAVASAAHVDIVRMEPLYQISPLAHRAVEYPSWYAATGWHLAVALACLAWAVRRTS